MHRLGASAGSSSQVSPSASNASAAGAADAVVTLGGSCAAAYSLGAAAAAAPPAAPAGPANPVPLGLAAFALTCFVLSVANAGIGFTHVEVVIGLALFFGGLVQLLAGQWSMATGDVFFATLFSAYSAFWCSWAYIVMPSSGVLAAYADAGELRSALGTYLLAWSLFTFMITVAARKTNVALFVTLCFLCLALPLLSAGYFAAPTVDGAPNAQTIAGGWMGLGCSFSAWYTMLSILVTPASAGFSLPNPKL